MSYKINGQTEILGVFGHPVRHSKSPTMHNALFKELGINAAYLPFGPIPENFSTALDGLKALHFRGANLTIPYKEQVLELVNELSPISEFTRSVNTLYWKNGEKGGTLCGTTTDPYGAIKNIEDAGVSLEGKSLALLGNGGAAKAIAYALLEKNVKLTIVCRNEIRGKNLVEKLSLFFPENVPTYCSFNDFNTSEPDIILNTTPVGMHPNVNDSPLPDASFRKEQFVYDIIYTPTETRLLKDAKAQGCKILNGEGMLVYQGAASFKLWFPKETENVSEAFLVSVMREALQKENSLEKTLNSNPASAKI